MSNDDLERFSIVWTDLEDYYADLDEEIDAIKEFVKQNPYPSFEKISEILPLREYAEYGNINHLLCKKIYENIFDNKVITRSLHDIYNRGGCQAVLENYYTICNHSPLRWSQLTKSYASNIQYCMEEATNSELQL
tara:strand:- start:1313 stop:1717 length:405 start_codon:yes stop_codon:yes gene_type:complete